MSLVDIRVDLPTHSHSFTVSVPSQYSVLQVKQEIYGICPGQPRPEGQRLIWRGRLLSDDETVESLWKTDPRIVHLAVHPSAWSSKPPEIHGYQPVQHTPGRPPYSPNTGSATPGHSRQHLRPVFAYVAHQHQKALSSLSSSIPLPNELETPEFHRLIAKNELKRNGWSWPDILDAEFPSPSEGGLLYVYTTMGGRPYLHLLNPDAKPTARQEHSLRVLTYTYTILHVSIPSSSPVRNVPTQSIAIPPHVNQLLQQMGLQPLRVVDNVVQAVANQENHAPDIREIPLRPLLAPLVMLFLRSMLLLYFVAPARKPIIGIFIFAWMLYEIWQPIRNGLRNGWGVVQDQQQQADNVAGQLRNNIAQPNANVGWQPGVNLPARPNILAGTLDQQFDAFMDGLANMNISDEESLLNTPSGVPTEPGVGRKIVTFVGLLVSTLHPAVWNRRRVALRRREGTIRTEANARNAPLATESSDSNNDGEIRVQVRDDLRARFESQPLWMQRYIQRVMDEEWVDDSD